MPRRTLLVPIACALLVAAPRAGAASSSASTKQPDTKSGAANQTCVVGDTLTMRGDREPAFGPEMIAIGHVHVTSPGIQLRGPHLEVYKTLHYGEMDGGVFGTDGLTALMARRLTFELPNHELYLDTGKIVIKEGMKPEQLTAQLDSADPYSMFRVGKNGLTLTGERVRRDAKGNIEAHDVWVTSCVCPDGCRPMLSVSAVDAYIVPKQRTWMVLPIYRLFNIPILPLPVGSLPMKSRETGLLFPLFGTTGPGGYSLTLPVFITLGDSADVTISPFYYFGVYQAGVTTPNNATEGGNAANSQSILGPGADVLFRWRPAVDAFGTLDLTYYYDTSLRDQGNAKSYRTSRGEGQFTHSQGLAGGHLGLSADVVSDGSVLADTQVSGARQNQSYTRSWAEYSKAFGSFNLSFDSNYVEALNTVPGACVNGQPCLLRQPLIDAETKNELPAVLAPVADLTLSTANRWGPAMFEEELNLAYEDFWGNAPETWNGNPTTANGQPITFDGQPITHSPHAPHLIGGLSFVQTLPVVRGRFGWIALETGERIQGTPSIAPLRGTTDDSASSAALRGGGYVGFTASSRIARTFANGWAHDIVPALQVRGLDSWSQDSDNFGFSPGLYADRVYTLSQTNPYRLGLLQSPLDMALPSQGTIQAIASLTTSLTPPKAPPMILRIEEHPTLYQRPQSGLSTTDPGQLIATLTLPIGLNTISLSGAYDLLFHDFTQGRAEYDRTLSFGMFKLGGAYLNGATGDQISRGLDTLFTPRFEMPNPSLPVPPGATPVQWQAYAGVNFHFGPLGILFNGVATNYPTAVVPYWVQSYGATVSWSCEGCGRLALTLSWSTSTLLKSQNLPTPAPNYQFGDMSQLGQAAQLTTFPTF